MSEPISVHLTTREGEQRLVTQSAGHQTLMQVLYEEDIEVEAICGGCTSCATCPVFVGPSWMSKLPERDQAELMLLQYAEHYDPDRPRLSCQLPNDPGPRGYAAHDCTRRMRPTLLRSSVTAGGSHD